MTTHPKMIVGTIDIQKMRKSFAKETGTHRLSQVVNRLILALLRYFDLIGDYVGGSLLFLFFAGVLFASARFWHAHTGKGAAP